VEAFPLFAPEPAAGLLPQAGGAVATPAAQAPEALHPALWRASQVGRQRELTWPSGFAPLDAELPGGGWPSRTLTELLLPHPGLGEMRLLAPALAAVQQQQRCVMLFAPPADLCGWAWQALGLDVQRLVLVHGRGTREAAAGSGPAPASGHPGGLRGRARDLLGAADILWALEHALKSGHVGAVLAWLPVRLQADALRRLQLAAQGHDGPAFLLRGTEARHKPSAAPLRLLLGAAGADSLRLLMLKRRGPPLALPLQLALPPVLSAPARARAMRPAVAPGIGHDAAVLPSADAVPG
jgi:protein ImuA